MTEIYMPILFERARKLPTAKRKELLHWLAERLAPLSAGQIGQMIDTNNLEAAFRMIEKHNQKAYNAWHEHNKRIPIEQRQKFKAPFWWNPNNDSDQQGKWGSMLREAFAAIL